jgi:hypothetical protein
MRVAYAITVTAAAVVTVCCIYMRVRYVHLRAGLLPNAAASAA